MLHGLHLRIMELMNVMVLMLILVRLCFCLVNPGLFLDSPSADASIFPAFPCECLPHLLKLILCKKSPEIHWCVYIYTYPYRALSFLLTASTSHSLSPALREIDLDSIQAPEPRSRDEFLQCECTYIHTHACTHISNWDHGIMKFILFVWFSVNNQSILRGPLNNNIGRSLFKRDYYQVQDNPRIRTSQGWVKIES